MEYPDGLKTAALNSVKLNTCVRKEISLGQNYFSHKMSSNCFF